LGEVQERKTNLGFLWCLPMFLGFTNAHWNPVTVPEPVNLKEAVWCFLLMLNFLILVSGRRGGRGRGGRLLAQKVAVLLALVCVLVRSRGQRTKRARDRGPGLLGCRERVPRAPRGAVLLDMRVPGWRRPRRSRSLRCESRSSSSPTSASTRSLAGTVQARGSARARVPRTPRLLAPAPRCPSRQGSGSDPARSPALETPKLREPARGRR
jgi:hypothetical protein